MQRVLKGISFLSFAMATHAGAGTFAVQFVPNLYPEPWMAARIQELLCYEAFGAAVTALTIYAIIACATDA